MISLHKYTSAFILGLAVSSSPAHPFETNAKQALILDGETGIVLFEKDARSPMVPASMTKMMTVYLLFERIKDGRLKPEDLFEVSENAWRKGGAASGGSTMFLEPNSKVSVLDLLKGIIVASGNDACIVVAENVSGSEASFAKEMTKTAKQLGLDTAEFRNATGLYNDEHRISALDLAKLARLTQVNFPDLYKIYSLDAFEWNNIRQPNRNPILGRVEGTTGLKTGHLDISGYGFTGSASQDGKTRIIVLNGTESKTERRSVAERLMRSAFRDFDVKTLFSSANEIIKVPVWLGTEQTISLGLAEPLVTGVEINNESSMSAEIILQSNLIAPISRGDVVGGLVVTKADGSTIQQDVIALESVDEKGLAGKAMVGLKAFLTPKRS